MLATQKKEVIEKFAVHEGDTGSSPVQIAVLTLRINQLMAHFKAHKKDNNSKRGFFKLIGQRRRLLRYLNRTEPDKYVALIKELGIRK